MAANEQLIDHISCCLVRWAHIHAGTAAHVSGARSLGGHSGVTIGFDLHEGSDTKPLVLKMLPPGVPARSNFDLMRQIPLLRALQAHDIPAPVPVSFGEDVSLFGSVYLITTRLVGDSFTDIFVKSAPLANAHEIFYDAVDRLADIHAIDALGSLGNWSQPRPIDQEIDHWIGVLHKSTDAAWIKSGLALADALRASAPRDPKIGLVHGDYYSNNWLHVGHRLTGIVDWEGTSIGPSLLDLGWLTMIYDPESWIEGRGGLDWAPPAEALIRRYAERSRTDVTRVGWYRALAAYRLACLTAYYYELHRTGKRHNAAWNVFARSFDKMVGTARRQIDQEF